MASDHSDRCLGSRHSCRITNTMPSRPRLSALVLLLATPTTHALAAAKRRKPSKPKTSAPDYIDILPDSDDVAWQCESVVATLKSGGVGVIPTDTGYAFCARVTRRTRSGACSTSKEPIRGRNRSRYYAEIWPLLTYTRAINQGPSSKY